jgi:hypothetical protein
MHGSEGRSVLELFPSGRPHRHHNHKSPNQPDILRSRHPDGNVVSTIAHTDRANLPRYGSDQSTAALDSKISKLESVRAASKSAKMSPRLQHEIREIREIPDNK